MASLSTVSLSSSMSLSSLLLSLSLSSCPGTTAWLLLILSCLSRMFVISSSGSTPASSAASDGAGPMAAAASEVADAELESSSLSSTVDSVIQMGTSFLVSPFFSVSSNVMLTCWSSILNPPLLDATPDHLPSFISPDAGPLFLRPLAPEPRLLNSTGSGSNTSGASLMSSTTLSSSYSLSIWSLNLANRSRESFFGMALSSSSTEEPQYVHLNSPLAKSKSWSAACWRCRRCGQSVRRTLPWFRGAGRRAPRTWPSACQLPPWSIQEGRRARRRACRFQDWWGRSGCSRTSHPDRSPCRSQP